MTKTQKFQPTEKELSDKVRWMIRRDLASILRIESTQQSPWSEEDFLSELRKRDVIGMVADIKGEIAGYIVYQLQNMRFVITKLVVAQEWQGCGVGRLLLSRLIKKLSRDRRSCIAMYVRETSLPLQQFLRAMGFKASKVVREHFDDSGEDAFVMEYKC